MAVEPGDFQEGMKNPKKMVFAGISNAGKTSIIRTLRNDIAGTALVKPTYLLDRSVFKYLDYEIIQHDMGGQRKYLINYLKEPGKFFNKIDACIFVVDILEANRLDESLEYFKNMLEKFEQIGETPRIWVLFHKAEKYLFEADKPLYEVIKTQREKFIAAGGTRFRIVSEITSIYDRWGLSKVFTMIFHVLYPRGELVQDTLKTIAIAAGASTAILIDDQLLPLSEYSTNQSQDEIVKATAPHLFKIEEGLEALKPTWKRWLKLEYDDQDIVYYEIPQDDNKKRLHLYLAGKLGCNDSTDLLLKIGKHLEILLKALYAS
jgi:hypothetical protein